MRQEELARQERERERQKEEARRLQAEELNVAVHLAPVGDLLVNLCMFGGNTVRELRTQATRQGKLPLRPRLLVDGKELPDDEELCMVGIRNGQRVDAEAFAIATGSKDGMCKIWNAHSGECVLTLAGHEGAVTSATMRDDLKWVATSSEDLTAKIWALDRWAGVVRCAMTLRGHTDTVTDVAFSPDGKWVVTASRDGTAKVWAMRTGQCSRTFEDHAAPLSMAVFEQDGAVIKTVIDEQPAIERVFQVSTGRCQSASKNVTITQTLKSPCGKAVLALEGPSVRVRDNESNEVIRELEGHDKMVVFATYKAVGLALSARPQSPAKSRRPGTSASTATLMRPSTALFDAGSLRPSTSSPQIGTSPADMAFQPLAAALHSQGGSGMTRYIKPQRRPATGCSRR
jgi:hypothetical protein